MDAVLSLLVEDLPAAMPMLGWALFLGYVGRYAVPMVEGLPDAKWRTWYLRTTWAHPVIVAPWLGLSPTLPVPSRWGDSWEASILWYALAGVVSVPVYRIAMRRMRGAGHVR